MSNRTLLEINHDHWWKIEQSPEEFAKAVLNLLQSGSTEHGVGAALDSFGVTVGPMRHHSSPNPLEGKTR